MPYRYPTPGVPLLRPVAGIAMGLILEPPATPGSAPRHVVLSDILGSEDSLGDMDFKVAGDYDTVTAFQMDIKVGALAVLPSWHRDMGCRCRDMGCRCRDNNTQAR